MGCSVLIRFICLYLEYVMEKSHKNAKKFWFLKIILFTLLYMAIGLLTYIFYYIYNKIYKKKLVYWGVLIMIIYIFDMIILDSIIIVIIV